MRRPTVAGSSLVPVVCGSMICREMQGKTRRSGARRPALQHGAPAAAAAATLSTSGGAPRIPCPVGSHPPCRDSRPPARGGGSVCWLAHVQLSETAQWATYSRIRDPPPTHPPTCPHSLQTTTYSSCCPSDTGSTGPRAGKDSLQGARQAAGRFGSTRQGPSLPAHTLAAQATARLTVQVHGV